MKKLLFTLAAATLCLPGLASAAEVGAPAPAIEAMDIDGNAFKLSDHLGKIVVLEWTNAECPFVMKHYDSGNMQKTQQAALAMDGVEWVSINSSAAGKQGHVSPEEAKAHLTEVNASPSVYLIDEDGTIGHAYGAQTTPHMFIVDKDGTLVYAGAIDDNSSPRQEVIAESNNYVLAALKNLEEGAAVEMPTSQPYGCSVKY